MRIWSGAAKWHKRIDDRLLESVVLRELVALFALSRLAHIDFSRYGLANPVNFVLQQLTATHFEIAFESLFYANLLDSVHD